MPSPGAELDVRGLEPPQPMVRILSTLETIAPGEHLVALLSRKPVYLLPLLEEAHHAYTISQLDDESWELRITKG